MKRRVFLGSILSTAAVAQAVAFFGPDHEGHGKGKQKESSHDFHHEDDEGPRHRPGPVGYFRPEDRVLLSRYYPAPSLPPGLRKKYFRTGTLPPGWQKRVQPLPMAVVEQLPPPPRHCERGYVDGYAVVYDRTTRVILDAVDLMGALTGR